MNTSSIPVCYFPSTTLFLDQNNQFLQHFAEQWPQPFIYHCLNNAADALQILNLQAENTHDIKNLNFDAFHWQIYNPQRFSEPSVIVIDMKAASDAKLAFCQQIQHHAIKKILLVDNNESELLALAVRTNLVNLCLNREDPNISSLLMNGIKHLQSHYFLTRPHAISPLPHCLSDPAFVDLFYQFKQEEGITEYYLLEESGSFLMLDNLGKPSGLIVKRQQDLLQHYNMGKNSNVPIDLLEEIKSGMQIPSFSPSHVYYQSEWTDWVNYIHKAQQLIGDEIYYYAYVKELLALDIHTDRLLSYKSYIEQTS